MKTYTAAAAAGLVVLTGAVLAQDRGAVRSDLFGPLRSAEAQIGISDYRVSNPAATVRQLENRLSSLQRQLGRVKSAVQAGINTAADAEPLEQQIQDTEAQLAAAKEELAAYQRAASLNRPVDVQLRDSSIKQAAETLSRASGITIQTDASVPADTRVTVAATRVPLSTVLESIARESHLMIAPAEKGVILKKWPSLKVNEQVQDYTGPMAPWSDEWRIPPTAISGIQWQGGANIPMIGGVPGGAVGVQSLPSMMPGIAGEIPFGGLGVSGSNPTLTPVGDRMVIVAQPGATSTGEPGTWLTVYEIAAGKLRRLSQTFHRMPGIAGPAMKPGPIGTSPPKSPRPIGAPLSGQEKPVRP